MIRIEDTVLVLLAAGRSQRFGVSDKLAEPFLGAPLGLHVVTALEALPVAARIAVSVAQVPVDFAAHGYRVVVNDDPAAGLGRSVQLGVKAVAESGARAVLIVLADMPRVTASHIHRLFDAAEDDHAVVASSDGVSPRPPALFGAAWFELLMGLEGDAGARDLIRAGHHVVASPAELIDVDTVADLERLRGMVGSR